MPRLVQVAQRATDFDATTAFYADLLGVEPVATFDPPGLAFFDLDGLRLLMDRGAPSSLIYLAVDDIDAARDDLIARGVDVSEVFHYAGGPFNNTVKNPRVAGRDSQGRSYYSFASFEDPDGNGWLLQEIKTRFPGREWNSTLARAMDVATLAELLRETEERHGHYEKTHAKHHWWDWYAPYLSARQNGGTPEEASAAADRYMDEVHHVPPR